VGRLKAAERSGRGGLRTPRMLRTSVAPATPSGDGGHCPLPCGRRRGGNAPLTSPWSPLPGGPSYPASLPGPASSSGGAGLSAGLAIASKGVFSSIQLRDRTDGELQPVACGIDQGSTREGFTVASGTHTDLTIDADAVTHVRTAVDVRRQMRRARRFRTTPCRPPRAHRAGGIPPSTRARWQWKLRVIDWLRRLCPISTVVVEDIAAAPCEARRCDASLSPLEVGKQWCSAGVRARGNVVPRAGWETHALRTELGLPQSRRTSEETFWAHCGDSWTLGRAPWVDPPPTRPRSSACRLPGCTAGSYTGASRRAEGTGDPTAGHVAWASSAEPLCSTRASGSPMWEEQWIRASACTISSLERT
jgi:hypothetical protein